MAARAQPGAALAAAKEDGAAAGRAEREVSDGDGFEVGGVKRGEEEAMVV